MGWVRAPALANMPGPFILDRGGRVAFAVGLELVELERLLPPARKKHFQSPSNDLMPVNNRTNTTAMLKHCWWAKSNVQMISHILMFHCFHVLCVMQWWAKSSILLRTEHCYNMALCAEDDSPGCVEWLLLLLPPGRDPEETLNNSDRVSSQPPIQPVYLQVNSHHQTKQVLFHFGATIHFFNVS